MKKSIFTLMAFCYCITLFAQQIAVRGRVIDEADQTPLIGVNITEKGKPSNGTITDIEGNFSLNIDRDAFITLSFVGYEPKTIAIEGRTLLSLTLKESEELLAEVVVTALGIKREEKALGYAVQKVKGETLQKIKGVDISTSLTGKVAGLNILNSNEFGREARILLRGESPLLIIDGVPFANMTLRDLSSDDIETITVLKGATASALYGSRGQSGAIMITTKRGGEKEGLSISVNSGTLFSADYLAIPELQSKYGRVLKKNDLGDLEYIRSADGSWGAPLEGQEVLQWDPETKSMVKKPYLPVGKDNFKNFLEQGHILNNNISISQKGSLGNIRASATWVNNKGQYPNSTFNKYTYSVGGDIYINKFSFSTSMAYNKNESPNLGFNGFRGYDPMYSLLIWSSPDWDLRDYKEYWLIPNEVQNNSYTAGNNNPYFDRYERTHSLNKDIFNGNFELSYEPASWIKSLMRIGYDTYSNRQDVKISKGSFQGGGTATVIPNGTEIWGESQKGSYNSGISRGYSINSDFILTVNNRFGDFVLDGFVGGSMTYSQNEGLEARTQGGLSVPGFYSLKSSVDPAKVNSRIYKKQTNSIYGRAALSWKSMIFIESTLRNDWVSTLPQSTRSYLYPSFSGSILLSELIPKTEWLSLWKIRSSWVSSKTPASIYAINSAFAITNNAWGTLSSTKLPTTIRGMDILPESTNSYEVGTALNLFKNRLTFDIAYYNKQAFDFIRNAGISPSSGYSSNFVNTEEKRTRKGVELTIGVTPVETNDFRWDLSFNWSKYGSYYTKLDSIYSVDRPWVKVGERTDSYVFRDYLRDPQGNIIHNASGRPEYSKYDSKYGNSDPDWIWGVNTSIKYKNWLFTLSMDGRAGGNLQTMTEMYMWRSGGHPHSLTEERYTDAMKHKEKGYKGSYIGQGVKVVSGTATYDSYGNILTDTRVFEPNDIPTTYKSYIEAYHKGTAWGGVTSAADIYSGTFLKIREVSLTYDFSKNLCSKIKMQQLSLSAVGQNLFLWAKDFKFSDPDGGNENFEDPSRRYLGLNIRMSF